MNENPDPPDLPPADDGASNAVDNAPESTATVQPRSGSGCAKMLFGVVVVLTLVAGGVWFAIQEARRMPEFYATVLQLDQSAAKARGQEFERNLIQLQNAARRQQPWKIEFSQDQINGWLTSDLLEKFPDAMPDQIKDPRAVIGQQEIKLAFKYQGTAGLSGIVVVTADVFCTDQPNEIAARVIHVRSGFMPLPVNPWIERVADAIRRAGIPVYWSNAGGSQVAVFTIPEHLSAKGDSQQVVIEAIELQPGKLIVAGRTEDVTKGTGIAESEPEKGSVGKNGPAPPAEIDPLGSPQKN